MNTTEQIAELCRDMGYSEVRTINGLICGILPYVFTWGLCVGVNEYGLQYRYCYKDRADAVDAIRTWGGDPEVPPTGPWIKRKGLGDDLANVHTCRPHYAWKGTDGKYRCEYCRSIVDPASPEVHIINK